MGLIHRFSARTIQTPTRIFDEEKLRTYITKEQKHTDRRDAEALIKVIMSKKGSILAALKPLGKEARSGSGAATIMGNNLGKPKWWQNALLSTWSVPTIKLYSYNNFTLAIYEEPTQGSRTNHRLVLSIEAHNTVNILAASDEAVRGGLKLNLKPTAPMS